MYTCTNNQYFVVYFYVKARDGGWSKEVLAMQMGTVGVHVSREIHSSHTHTNKVNFHISTFVKRDSM